MEVKVQRNTLRSAINNKYSVVKVTAALNIASQKSVEWFRPGQPVLWYLDMPKLENNICFTADLFIIFL